MPKGLNMEEPRVNGVYLKPIGNHDTDPFLKIDNRYKTKDGNNNQIMKDALEELFKLIHKNRWAW